MEKERCRREKNYERRKEGMENMKKEIRTEK